MVTNILSEQFIAHQSKSENIEYDKNYINNLKTLEF